MTQKHNTSGYTKATTTTDVDVAGAAFINSDETAMTWFYGSSDPSVGAPSAWGSAEVGYNWLNGTDAANILWRRWCQLTTDPTYGWRDMRVRKVLQPSEPVAVNFSGASPAAADTGWTEVNLASLLDSDVQDSGQIGVTVHDVTLFVTLTPGASETVGASNCFIEFRRDSGTLACAKLKAQVATFPVCGTVKVPLAVEKFEYRVVVGGGTPSCAFTAYIIEATEIA